MCLDLVEWMFILNEIINSPHLFICFTYQNTFVEVSYNLVF